MYPTHFFPLPQQCTTCSIVSRPISPPKSCNGNKLLHVGRPRVSVVHYSRSSPVPRPQATAGPGPNEKKSSFSKSHPRTPATSQNPVNAQKEEAVYVELFEVAGTEAEHGARPWEPSVGPSPAKTTTPGPLSKWIGSLDFSEPMTFDGEEKTEYDPLRDGPLRYLGYANELGEAFAAWLFPGGVPLSYAVAIGYVLFDTADKYNKTSKDAQIKLTSRLLPPSVDVDKLVWTIGMERGVDTFVWQLIASVAAPGYTIHTVVGIVSSLLREIEKYPATEAAVQATATFVDISPEVLVSTLNKGLPTAMGLLAIPFIVHPIDASVHALLNASLRPWLRRFMCEEAGGKEAGLVVCACSKDEK